MTGVHGHVAAALLAEMQDVQGGGGGDRSALRIVRRCSGVRGASAKVEWRPGCCGGARGQRRVVESRGKVKGQRMGCHLRWGTRQPVRAAGYVVGGQLLAVL